MRRDTRGRGDRFGLVRLALLALGLAMGSLLAQGARAESPIPRTPAGAALEWFLNSVNAEALPTVEDIEARFTPEFLAQVPAAQLVNTTKGLRTQLGSLEVREVREESAHRLMATVHSSKADAPFAVHVGTEEEPPHRMSALFIRPLPRPAPAGDTWLKIDEDLVALGERVSFAAMRVNGDAGFVPVHMLHEDESLAIGSTFKLWILGALGEEVRAGDLRFEDTLAIRDEWKSLPSGTMQFEPAGKAFALREYAEKMISMSDNTATDHLLYAVGRENAERFMRRFVKGWERNVPMLSTRDMFAMKLGADTTLPDRYLAEDASGRRQMLDGEVRTAKMNLQQLWQTPRRIDTLEWFASAEELCETIAWLAREGEAEGMSALMGAMSRNPGIALDRERWSAFAYKGGSEPGVMNLTWWLRRADGVEFTLSVGVNDTARPLNEAAVVEIAQRAVALLASWER